MKTPYGAWRASYIHGRWTVLSGPTSMVVLEPTQADRSEFVAKLWTQLLDCASVADISRTLAAHGLDSMSNLAVFFWDDEQLHCLLRGSMKVFDAESDAEIASGEGAFTWREATLASSSIHLPLDELPDGGEQIELPLVVGAVQAATIYLDAAPGAVAPAAAKPSAGLTTSAGQARVVADAAATPERQAALARYDAGAGGQVEDSVSLYDSPFGATLGTAGGSAAGAGFGAAAGAAEPSMPLLTMSVPPNPDAWGADGSSSDEPAFDEPASDDSAPDEPRHGESAADRSEAPDAVADHAAERAADVAEAVRESDAEFSESRQSGVTPWSRGGVSGGVSQPANWDPASAEDEVPLPEADQQAEPRWSGADAEPSPASRWSAPEAADQVVDDSDVSSESATVAPEDEIPQAVAPEASDSSASHGAADDADDRLAPAPDDVPPAVRREPTQVLGQRPDYAPGQEPGSLSPGATGAANQPLGASGTTGPWGAAGFGASPTSSAPPEPDADASASTPALMTSSGEQIALDGPVLIGRSPNGQNGEKTVRVLSPNHDISRTHVRIEPVGSAVEVTDMNSTNGTVVVFPDGESVRLEPGQSIEVDLGGAVELGDGQTISLLEL
ncbi:FHA domain-containing protein [Propionimicrobium sp. PCR01-08-3]|uniref:FHA domain-containing protein n=1 Tax=Propionimicrobium sp. PCR01-08-3 TaxID=3052086 RepID=UPI00255CDC0F|nr:FHA domain-containing protein [Propionimicrobium sp. PCR01-08-3]WIY82845.1 FHA domain-containing protein [Propionimicrobium sp. PCR01-08-3]